jgi:hypothetical protein
MPGCSCVRSDVPRRSSAISYPREFPVFARYILPVLLSFAVKQLRKRNVRGASMPTSRARSRSRFRF